MQLYEPKSHTLSDCQDYHHQRSLTEKAGHSLEKPPTQLPGQDAEKTDSEFPVGERLDIPRSLVTTLSKDLAVRIMTVNIFFYRFILHLRKACENKMTVGATLLDVGLQSV